MSLLGIDVGTTHLKVGVFTEAGRALRVVTRPTPPAQPGIDPEALWQSAASAIAEAAREAPPIRALGVAGMAETGLLLDRATGQPRSPLVPWHDTAAEPQARVIGRHGDPVEQRRAFGQPVSFKASLAKILALQAREPAITRGALWLGAPEYLAWRLAGVAATDFSLACRAYAFDLRCRAWDAAWLAQWGLEPDLFPPARLAGEPVGQAGPAGRALGLPSGLPVSVAGHDHVCAAFAAGVAAPEAVFDSMGTAETLVGALAWRELTAADGATGLIYGCHVLPETLYWMGALSAAGGSVDWLRALLGAEPISYEDLAALVEAAGPEPTGLLFFPYLLGSASPHRDGSVRGALVGLGSQHGRAALARAVLEGAAYELEFARRVGEQAAGRPIRRLVAAGGGARLRAWLQIKADVSNVTVERLAEPEATLLGAALLAGIGAGVYADHAAALAATRQRPAEIIAPDAQRHARYRELFEHGYLRLQAPLRELGQWQAG